MKFSHRITYKKGQIVPFFLAETRPRKYAHLIKFGCDVNVVGRTITALSDGPVIVIERDHKGKKGKPNCYPNRCFDAIKLVPKKIVRDGLRNEQARIFKNCRRDNWRDIAGTIRFCY